MRTRVEWVEGLDEAEIILRCSQLTPPLRRLLQQLQEAGHPALEAEKDGQAIFLQLEDVYFLETDGDAVYAHTADRAYRVRQRLYQLETTLPAAFVRVSKSAIVHVRHIAAVARGTAAGRITFRQTHKTVYVSRRYRSVLQDRMRAVLLGSGE